MMRRVVALSVPVVASLLALAIATVAALAIATVAALTTAMVCAVETAGLYVSQSTEAKQIDHQEDMWKSSTYPL